MSDWMLFAFAVVILANIVALASACFVMARMGAELNRSCQWVEELTRVRPWARRDK